MLQLYIDADACPVKDEVYRVAARYNMPVHVVSCQQMRAPAYDKASLVVVADGPDIADDWIAEHITDGDICITDDIPLAARCIEKGAPAINARGRILNQGNIGETLATRDLLDSLRGAGTIGEAGGGPKPYSKRDRSKFLESLELTVRKILREH